MVLEQVLSSFTPIEKKAGVTQRIISYCIARIKLTLNYKINFFMTLILNILTIFLYFYFAKLTPNIKIFGFNVSYLHFLAIGLSLQMIVGTSLATTENAIATEIVTGTFSSIVPYFNPLEYALGVSLAGVLLSLISVFVSFSIITLLGNVSFSITALDLVMIMGIFILIVLSNVSISLFISAFVIWYKKPSGFTKIIYQLYKTFSGIAFPIALLSGFPLVISKSLPLTYGLEALQKIILTASKDYKLVLNNSVILLILTTVLTLVGAVLVKLALTANKKKNSIWWY